MNQNVAFSNDDELILDNRDDATPSRLAPPAPHTLEDTRLSESFICDLILRHLYIAGILTGREVAHKLRLPFLILDPILDELIRLHQIEKRGGQGMGNISDRFSLTDRGRNYARQLMDMDTYAGPAPVTLEEYADVVISNGLGEIHATQEALREAWKDYRLDNELFEQVGPAIHSCKSCFLYGPPGTGKTMLAKAISRFLYGYCGPMPIPHAILAGGNVIRVYDPSYHELAITTEVNENPLLSLTNSHDERWVMCKRPTVIVGGELNMDMLDLRFNAISRYYEAPMQMKANGGVLIVDDFGRQRMRPEELLNRWIIPLEEKLDYLTLHTGKKISIPFEEFVIFATNLDPKALGDEAFTRRIRYKIFVGSPSLEIYKLIFQDECKKKNIPFDAEALDSFIQRCYFDNDRAMRACEPRDLTDLMLDNCTFNKTKPVLSEELLNQAATSYFLNSYTNENAKPFPTQHG